MRPPLQSDGSFTTVNPIADMRKYLDCHDLAILSAKDLYALLDILEDSGVAYFSPRHLTVTS